LALLHAANDFRAGFSGQAFSTFVPHTVRAKETKQCSDCHVSAQNDNNAWMAQLLLQGTSFMNFMGRYIYVATARMDSKPSPSLNTTSLEVIYGSDLQRVAYPDNFKNFVEHHRELSAAAGHSGSVLDIQARGEYAYAALGPGGLRVYDIANIDNKSFSEKVTTAPVSPIGQKFYVATKNALAVASPTTLGVDPLRRNCRKTRSSPFTRSTVSCTSPTRKKGWSSLATPISNRKVLVLARCSTAIPRTIS